MNLILQNGEKAIDLNDAFQKAVGIRPDLQSVRRWYRKGIKGLKLEIVRVGGRVYTSVEAVQRFISARSASPGVEQEQEQPVRKFAKPDPKARAAGLRRHFPNYAG